MGRDVCVLLRDQIAILIGDRHGPCMAYACCFMIRSRAAALSSLPLLPPGAFAYPSRSHLAHGEQVWQTLLTCPLVFQVVTAVCIGNGCLDLIKLLWYGMRMEQGTMPTA